MLQQETAVDEFSRVVISALQPNFVQFAAGYVVAIDNTRYSDQFKRDMRAMAGIDALHITERGHRGIVCRVSTHSIDKAFYVGAEQPEGRSEYRRRKFVLDRPHEGYFYPHWTLQACVDGPGGELQWVGVVKTADLFSYIEHCLNKVIIIPKTRPNAAGETCYCVKWDDLTKFGIKVDAYVPETLLSRMRARSRRKSSYMLAAGDK